MMPLRVMASISSLLILAGLALYSSTIGIEENYCIMTYMLQWPNVCVYHACLHVLYLPTESGITFLYCISNMFLILFILGICFLALLYLTCIHLPYYLPQVYTNTPAGRRSAEKSIWSLLLHRRKRELSTP